MLLNEILQWAVLLLGLFFLAGAYRLISERPHSGILNLDQETGPRIGRQLSSVVTDYLAELKGQRPLLIGFVTEGCPACGGLLDHVFHTEEVRALSVVLVVGHSSEQFASSLALHSSDCLVIYDDQNRIFSVCGVTATPYVVLTDQNFRVMDKRVTSDVREMLTVAETAER